MRHPKAFAPPNSCYSVGEDFVKIENSGRTIQKFETPRCTMIISELLPRLFLNDRKKIRPNLEKGIFEFSNQSKREHVKTFFGSPFSILMVKESKVLLMTGGKEYEASTAQSHKNRKQKNSISLMSNLVDVECHT
jgi:hypothetical protein